MTLAQVAESLWGSTAADPCLALDAGVFDGATQNAPTFQVTSYMEYCNMEATFADPTHDRVLKRRAEEKPVLMRSIPMIIRLPSN